MAKKYLSLAEAAEAIGVSTSELIRLREKSAIRGFADRGTWKFSQEDVTEFVRRRQTDSDQEVPLLSEAAAANSGDTDQEQSVLGSSDELLDAVSDSDVRLIIDESLVDTGEESGVEMSAPLSDSDSDVQLADDGDQAIIDTGADSGSDVQLADGDSDSDVQIAEEDSDSDVRLSKKKDSETAGSDSDVQLVSGDSAPDLTSDSDVRLISEETEVGAGSDSDVRLSSEEDASTVLSDSDIALAPPGDQVADANGGESGISLDDLIAADSGISLEGADSGITLEGTDSGITLEGTDSGLSLEEDSDSGLSLVDAGDSGIALDNLSDSGIALSGQSDDLNGEGTIPMLDVSALEGSPDETQLEVPSLDFEEEIDLNPTDDQEETSVILFDDEDEVEDEAPIEAAVAGGIDDELETLEGESVYDIAVSDAMDEIEEFEDADELEVSEDVFGEDDELEELDVFGAEDEDFDDSLQTGESRPEFLAPVAAGGQIAAPAEVEWGVGTFLLLLASTSLMVICLMMMFDLVRSMWGWHEAAPFNSFFLDTFRDLI